MNEKTLSASPTRVASYPITSPDNAQIQSQPQASARRRQNRATTQPNPEPVYDDSVFNTHNDARRAQSEPQKGVLRRMTTGLFTPERKVGKAPSFLASFKAAILSSWINILLVFIPIGWALHFVKDGGNGKITDTAVFVTTFISIMPLAGLLGFATEEAALRMGETLGGLLNATLGNAVELIVAILALIKCELAVVQSSLVGSILSNILLVLGMCFFAGGLRYAEQTMKSTAAQLNSSLLLIAVIAVLIPSAFHFAIQTGSDGQPALSSQTEGDDLLAMSHAVAILLLVLYLGYLVFQMWSHATLFNDDDMGPQSTRYGPEITGVKDKVKNYRFKRNRGAKEKSKVEDEEGGMMPVSTTMTTTTGSNTTRGDMTGSPEMMPTDLGTESSSATSGATTAHQQLQGGRTKDFNDGPVQIPTGPRGARAADEESEEEEEEPQMNIWATMIVLIVVTVLVGVTAEFLVSSINGLVESNPSLSAEWVGLILLPIVGNAAEHFTAVSVSVKDKLDLSISVAVGSSIQVALFVIPVIQLLAWTIGKPMTLLFDPYEVIVLFLSVLVVNQTLADGRSNWMEGLVLMLLYLIIAVSFWYYPGSDTATLLGC